MSKWTVTKRIEVSGSHHLTLPYPSKCAAVHGHNWIITVTCEANHLNESGMVMDFAEIKEVVMQLDHDDINQVLEVDLGTALNPTAENIAKWIADKLGPRCKRVEVQESEGNVAEYTR